MKNSFPLTAKYDKQWIKENTIGENVLYNLESLCQVLPLKEGMRILDLGCGNAISSIFLTKEFKVKVWAIDENIHKHQNEKRISQHNCQDHIFPFQLNVTQLTFPKEYFDAIIAVDSFHYYGTSKNFLPYIMEFLKPKGWMGIFDYCFTQEVKSVKDIPQDLTKAYPDYWHLVHTLAWWKNHWLETGLVNIKHCEVCPDCDFIWQEFIKDYERSENEPQRLMARALSQDSLKLIGLFRMVVQKK